MKYIYEQERKSLYKIIKKCLCPYQLKRVFETETCIDTSCFEILTVFASRLHINKIVRPSLAKPHYEQIIRS